MLSVDEGEPSEEEEGEMSDDVAVALAFPAAFVGLVDEDCADDAVEGTELEIVVATDVVLVSVAMLVDDSGLDIEVMRLDDVDVSPADVMEEDATASLS